MGHIALQLCKQHLSVALLGKIPNSIADSTLKFLKVIPAYDIGFTRVPPFWKDGGQTNLSLSANGNLIEDNLRKRWYAASQRS